MKIVLGRQWAVALAIVLCIGVGAYVTNAASSAFRAAPPAAPKIATIDIEEVFNGLNERIDKEKALTSAGEDAQKRLLALKAEFDADKAKFDTMPYTPAKIVAIKALRDKRELFELKERGEQRSLSETKAEMFRDLYAKITDAVGRMAQKEAYHMVFSSDQKVSINSIDLEVVTRSIGAKRMLFVDSSLDITADIVKMLNTEYATLGSAPAPAPKKP